MTNFKEVDFNVVKEDWSRYLAKDGSIVKVRIVVKKILEGLKHDASGYADFTIDSMNAVSAMVPERLKREPSKEPWNPKTDVPEEIGFEPMEERMQEYITNDGFKIFVKPVITKIFRYNKYNLYGEPIYNVIIQAIVNVEKVKKEQPSQ